MAWNPKARYILISARACIECFPGNFTKMILRCACCEFLIALICPVKIFQPSPYGCNKFQSILINSLKWTIRIGSCRRIKVWSYFKCIYVSAMTLYAKIWHHQWLTIGVLISTHEEYCKVLFTPSLWKNRLSFKIIFFAFNRFSFQM